MGVLGYSTTAGSNNTALAGVGSLGEGVMQIKQVNDALRQSIADIAQMYSDTVAGIYTTGTSTAFLVATASGHASYSNALALRVRFHLDCPGGVTTINVNGLGTKGLKIFVPAGVRDPIAGEIKADMVYDCVYVAALNCVVVTGSTVVVDVGVYQPLTASLTNLGGLVRTRGDIIRGGAAGWEDLAIGAAGRNLVSDGTDLVYSTAFSYTNVTAFRAANTNYTNTGNRPLAVVVNLTYNGANTSTQFQIGGVSLSKFDIGNGFTGLSFSHSVIVPPGAVFRLNVSVGSITLVAWHEGAL